MNLNNLITTIISSIIFIISFVTNFKTIKYTFKIIIHNLFGEDRFILEDKAYSILGNKKYLISFGFYYILNIIILFISFVSVLIMWHYLNSDRFNLVFNIFSLVFPLYTSFNILDSFNKAKEKFQKLATSIDDLEAINDYKKCKEFIEAKKYKLTREDARELNSYYRKVYNINEDCFLSYAEEAALRERLGKDKKNKQSNELLDQDTADK